jgi:hypothetical protein
LVLLILPVLFSALFAEIAGRNTFRLLHTFINLIVLGLVTNIEIYQPVTTLVICLLIIIFTFLP